VLTGHTDDYRHLYARQYDGIANLIITTAALMGNSIPEPHDAAVTFVALRQGLALERNLPSPAHSEEAAQPALRQWIEASLGLRLNQPIG
jgi:hypothetical protein